MSEMRISFDRWALGFACEARALMACANGDGFILKAPGSCLEEGSLALGSCAYPEEEEGVVGV